MAGEEVLCNRDWKWHLGTATGTAWEPPGKHPGTNLGHDVMVRYEHSSSLPKDAAVEKAKKYKRLLPQIKDLVNAADTEFVGFPLGAWEKWYGRNSELLVALGLSKMRLEKIAQALASRALFSSVDIIHIFASKARLFVTTE